MRKAQAVVEKLLYDYGIQRQVTKGVWPPGGVQILKHLGVGVNLQQGVFYVPPKRMTRIRQHARSIRAAKCSRRRRHLGGGVCAAAGGCSRGMSS